MEDPAESRLSRLHLCLCCPVLRTPWTALVYTRGEGGKRICNQSMKVVSYNPSDTAEHSGSLSGTSCPPQPHLEVMRTPLFLTQLEVFLRGDQSMKVVSYDPSDTARPSGFLSRTSCPPQPHLEDTPILDVFRDIFKRRTVYESCLLQPIGHSRTPRTRINQSSIICVCVCVCLCVCV